jgi:CO/xanthine dehydrogenase FAD-binding subunit
VRASKYEVPETVEAAVALLAGSQGRGRVFAGGTDLLVQLRTGRAEPELLVDVKRIERMTRVDRTDSGFRIGAAVCAAELAENAALAAVWPGVVEAAELIGSMQIQGRASLGGNLCNASPAADSVPALVAAGARCVIAGPPGEREVAVAEIPTGPGATSLAEGEVLVEFLLPDPPPRTADAYLRMIPRSEMDIAIVGAGVCLSLDGEGRCSDARVALGAVAPTVREVPAATQALVGSVIDDAALAAVEQAARAACSPIDDHRGTIDYRTRVAGVLARRATALAHERAKAR